VLRVVMRPQRSTGQTETSRVSQLSTTAVSTLAERWHGAASNPPLSRPPKRGSNFSKILRVCAGLQRGDSRKFYRHAPIFFIAPVSSFPKFSARPGAHIAPFPPSSALCFRSSTPGHLPSSTTGSNLQTSLG
jgi:hypothetical protein